MNPLQFSVYKGMGGKWGAVQLSFQPPHFYKGKEKDFKGTSALDENGRLKRDDGWKEREGAVFVNITSPKGKNVYDWDDKIVMALSVNDMAEVLHFLETGRDAKGGDSLSLLHDPGAKTESQGAVKKFLRLNAKDLTQGAMLTVVQQTGSDKKEHVVPLSCVELVTVKTLLRQAITKAMAW